MRLAAEFLVQPHRRAEWWKMTRPMAEYRRKLPNGEWPDQWRVVLGKTLETYEQLAAFIVAEHPGQDIEVRERK